MSADIIPLHRGFLTEAEQSFDRDLRAERDGLSAEYDRRATYELEMCATEPLETRSHEAIRDAATAGTLLIGIIIGIGLGSLLTILAALLIDGAETLAGWL